MAKRIGFACAVAAFLVAASFTTQAGSREPRWAHSWQSALEEAKVRNVPIFVSFHQDH